MVFGVTANQWPFDLFEVLTTCCRVTSWVFSLEQDFLTVFRSYFLGLIFFNHQIRWRFSKSSVLILFNLTIFLLYSLSLSLWHFAFCYMYQKQTVSPLVLCFELTLTIYNKIHTYTFKNFQHSCRRQSHQGSVTTVQERRLPLVFRYRAPLWDLHSTLSVRISPGSHSDPSQGD